MRQVQRRMFLQAAAGSFLTIAARPSLADSAPLALSKVAEGVYAFHGEPELMSPANQGAICNLGVIVGRDGVAVIDSGGSLIEARRLVAAVAKVTDRPIRYLINTHMHPDHVFGNAVFRDLGATLVGHRNLPQALMSRAETYLHNFTRDLGREIMAGVDIVPPTELVDDLRELDIGGRKITLKAWKPAHTDNDLTVLDQETSTLFSGDLVFVDHIPTLDGSMLGWMAQLGELSAIPASGCVPGHGKIPQAWPTALADEQRYFKTLVGDMRAAIKAGVPMAKAISAAAASERGKWKLFEEFNERNAAAVFAELEWE